MLLKLKNKTLLGMDKLLKDAEDRKGVPDYFVFEPKEAADFIREIIIDQHTFKKYVDIKQNNDNDNVDIRFLLKQILTPESLHLIVNKWFKHEITIHYHCVEIQVIKKKVLEDKKSPEFAVGKEREGWDTPDVPVPQGALGEDHVLTPLDPKILISAEPEWVPPRLPPPPTPPLSRIIKDHTLARCESCGSSMHRKWGVLAIDGCIQPECEKYYLK